MFPFLKTKLFLFLVIAAVVATFYYFGDSQKLVASIMPKLKNTPLTPLVEKLETLDSKKLTEDFQVNVQNTEAEILELSEKTADVSKHATNILGSSVTVASEQDATPIHEKAFEYGKYVYCKQVVDDYEKLNPSLR